jgi:predicted membrane protein (TIGR00267 family)
VDKSDDLRERFAQRVDDVREYGRIAGVAEIARRYFAMNAFDGVLTTIGVLMGNYLGDVRSPGTVIRIGVATSIAMGVSGLWGAYLTEAAERQRELAELEKVSLTDLGQTKIGRASRMAVVIVALVDGMAPAGAALIVLIPLFAAPLIGNILISYALSLALALIGLFGLGMFLGQISGRGLIGYGLRTLVAGLVSIALSFVLGGVGP